MMKVKRYLYVKNGDSPTDFQIQRLSIYFYFTTHNHVLIHSAGQSPFFTAMSSRDQIILKILKSLKLTKQSITVGVILVITHPNRISIFVGVILVITQLGEYKIRPYVFDFI